MKISVAMATYNGEKYIRRQIETIFHQSVQIDELVVSDDGSTDRTLEIVRSFKDDRIKIITDNPNPGCCGNFGWAVQHTTGDVIFLADQDDIWNYYKVEKIIRIFELNPDINFVITNGYVMDKEENEIDEIFNPSLINEATGILSQNKYLGCTVWSTLANGMCMCFTCKFVNKIMPFPDSRIHHDLWISFCAMVEDNVYYLNENLVGYRIHDTNISKKGNVPLFKRIKKNLKVVFNAPYDMVNIADAMLKKLKEHNLEKSDYYETVCHIRKVNQEQMDAYNESGIKGVRRILKLYSQDELYRNNGQKYFVMQLLIVIFGMGRNEQVKMK